MWNLAVHHSSSRKKISPQNMFSQTTSRPTGLFKILQKACEMGKFFVLNMLGMICEHLKKNSGYYKGNVCHSLYFCSLLFQRPIPTFPRPGRGARYSNGGVSRGQARSQGPAWCNGSGPIFAVAKLQKHRHIKYQILQLFT